MTYTQEQIAEMARKLTVEVPAEWAASIPPVARKLIEARNKEAADMLEQLAAEQGKVAGVTALDWRDLENGQRYALDPFCGYYQLDGENWTHTSMSGWLGGGADGAQADYEARIRAALEAAPDARTYADGLEDAAKVADTCREQNGPLSRKGFDENYRRGLEAGGQAIAAAIRALKEAKP